MRINEKLNLVIPLYDSSDQIYAYVHATPFSREVFEANYLLLSKTFTAIYREGLGEIAGPRVAALTLRNVARLMNEDDSESLSAPIMNEIRRLSNVLIPGPTGWEMRTLHDALSSKLFDEDDASEVENALVFFTVSSSMHHRQRLKDILPGVAMLWGAQITSLNATAFGASLRTSTEIVSSGATASTSSVPS